MTEPIKNVPQGLVSFEERDEAMSAAYQQGLRDAKEVIAKERDARWRVSLDEIDTHQARAQIEALRAIAEELGKLSDNFEYYAAEAVRTFRELYGGKNG